MASVVKPGARHKRYVRIMRYGVTIDFTPVSFSSRQYDADVVDAGVVSMKSMRTSPPLDQNRAPFDNPPAHDARPVPLSTSEAQDSPTEVRRSGAMPQPPPWKRVLATGLHFAPLRRACHLAVGLAAQAQHARDQLGTVIGEPVAAGRHRNGELGRIVRSGADRQLAGIGLVSKRDLVAFERRIRPRPVARAAEAKKKLPARRDIVSKPRAASKVRPSR
jgi:hypothetical protein